MNQSSLTISDAGKTSTLLKSNAAEVQTLSDSEDSGSFLNTLGAIFQSDTEKTEQTKAGQLDEVVTEIDEESIDKLIESDGDVELSENDDILLEKQLVADGESLEVDGEQISEKSELLVTSSVPAESNKTAKVMSEGNELLDRLDDSKQVLKTSSGNSLPPEHIEPISNQLQKNTAIIEPYIVQDENTEEKSESNQNMTVDEVIVASEDSELSDKGQVKESSETVGTLVGALPISKELTEQAVQKKQILESPNALAAEDKNNRDVTQSLSVSNTSHTDSEEPLIWDTAKVSGEAAALSQVMPSTLTASSSIATETVKSDSEANIGSETQTILAQAPISSADKVLLDEKAEMDSLAQINWSTSIPEQHKAPIDTGKLASSGALAASAQQNQLSQLNQSVLQSQTTAMDKLVQQTPLSVTNSDVSAAASVAQPLNPAPIMSSNSNQANQSLKAALAGGSLLGAAKAMGSDKGDNKETNLTQQLSGLASTQGAVQAQAKAETQQALSQSPLQLSREGASEKLSEQVQMMMSKNLRNIDIRLDPPELGRMQIRMSMNNDIASVQFTVSNPQAREMVEQAMPRLREMLAQQGLQLSDSSVHQQSSGQQQHQYATGNGDGSAGENGGSLTEDSSNLDESINLDVNIASKGDGISFYA